MAYKNRKGDFVNSALFTKSERHWVRVVTGRVPRLPLAGQGRLTCISLAVGQGS